MYLAIIAIATLIIAVNVGKEMGLGQALHHGSFQVISVITTTGYITVDFDKWPDLSQTFSLLLMFVGRCSGSTGELCQGHPVSRSVQEHLPRTATDDPRKGGASS